MTSNKTTREWIVLRLYLWLYELKTNNWNQLQKKRNETRLSFVFLILSKEKFELQVRKLFIKTDHNLKQKKHHRFTLIKTKQNRFELKLSSSKLLAVVRWSYFRVGVKNWHFCKSTSSYLRRVTQLVGIKVRTAGSHLTLSHTS